MESEGNEKNNEEVKLKQELFINVFSILLFKMSNVVHTKVGEKKIIEEETTKVTEKVTKSKEASCDVIIEKPVFLQDENGDFKFADGTEENFGPYHSDDKPSFAEAFGFLKEFDRQGLGLIETAYIKLDVIIDKAKKFLGIKEKEEDPNLKDILVKLQSEENKEKYSKVIKNIDDLPKCAGNLNLCLNKKIESTDHDSLMKISTEIKKAYFNFQENIKKTLKLIDEIIDSVYKKRLLSEIIKDAETGNEKSLSQSELRDYRLFCLTLNICSKTINKMMEDDKTFYNGNKKLYDVYRSSLLYIIRSFGNQQYDNINQDAIKRIGLISQFCASYLYGSKFNLDKIDSEKIKDLKSIKANNYNISEQMGSLDEFAVRFPFDNKQLFYKMIDDEIDITEKELRYAKNIADLEKALNSLNGIKDKLKLYSEFQSSFLLVRVVNVYDCLYKTESALCTCEKDIQVCKEKQEVLNSLRELIEKSNDIKNQIDQTEKNIKTCTDDQIRERINENETGLNTLNINSSNLNESNSSGIEQKINSVGTKSDSVNNNLRELNNKRNDLNTQLKNFVAENETVLKELNINLNNLHELDFDGMKKQLDSVYQQLIEKRQEYLDKVSKKNNFINQKQGYVKKLRESDKKFDDYVENTEYIINEMKEKKDEFNNNIERNKSKENSIRNYLSELKKEMIEKIEKYQQKYKKGICNKPSDSLERLEKTINNCVKRFVSRLSNCIGKYNLQLETNDKDLETLKLEYEKLITQTSKELENPKDNVEQKKHESFGEVAIANKIKKLEEKIKKLDKVAIANNIKKLKEKIKKLKAFYIVIQALEQQAGNLNAYKNFVDALNYKLLEAAKNGKELKCKSVNELLSGENAIIRTNYISKDDLQKIKNQNEYKKHGSLNTILRYGDKFLKEGDIFKSFGVRDQDVLQLQGMDYYKENSDVLIDAAYNNNIVNEIASFLGFDVIIGSDIVISDGNTNILMMDDASKNNRRDGQRPFNKDNAEKLISDKNKLQKLWDSTSALAFLDIVMMQPDRNSGNYFYNEESVRGIDNDYFAPVSSFYKKYYQRDFGKINKIRRETKNIEYDESNITAMALAKMPVISTALKNKILSIDRNQFELQLNSSFRDDINREDKVNGILNRFDKLIELINNGTIEVCKEINNYVMFETKVCSAVLYAELLIVTGEHYCSKKDCRTDGEFLYKNQFLSIISQILDYLPEKFRNPIGWDKKSEVEYHKWMLKKILNKKSANTGKSLLKENKLKYIEMIIKEIEKTDKINNMDMINNNNMNNMPKQDMNDQAKMNQINYNL